MDHYPYMPLSRGRAVRKPPPLLLPPEAVTFQLANLFRNPYQSAESIVWVRNRARLKRLRKDARFVAPASCRLSGGRPAPGISRRDAAATWFVTGTPFRRAELAHLHRAALAAAVIKPRSPSLRAFEGITCFASANVCALRSSARELPRTVNF